MKILKKVNNNVVAALNNKNEEIFVVGKGLGFRKTPYSLEENDAVIEKIFVAPKNIQMFDLFNDLPIDCILTCEAIVQEGTLMLNTKLQESIIFTLSEHINYAIERCSEHIEIKNPLQWEIKHLYPNEMKVGLRALEMIKERLNIELPQVEATFIALHFVNAQLGNENTSKFEDITEIISSILSIVKYQYKMEFDEDSMNFTRFVTHIRYFIQRQMSGTQPSDENEVIYKMMKEKSPKEVECIDKIEKYITANYGWTCSNDEKLYLILHIQRLTNRANL